MRPRQRQTRPLDHSRGLTGTARARIPPKGNAGWERRHRRCRTNARTRKLAGTRSTAGSPTKRKGKKRTRPGLPGRVHTSAITYFPAEQYHRRQGLNFCVRDGNRCDPLPIFTDKTLPPPSRRQEHLTSHEKRCDPDGAGYSEQNRTPASQAPRTMPSNRCPTAFGRDDQVFDR